VVARRTTIRASFIDAREGMVERLASAKTARMMGAFGRSDYSNARAEIERALKLHRRQSNILIFL